MVFTRPSTIPRPTTWHRFTSGSDTFRIQDLTDDMFEEALDLLTKYFARDEPPCRCVGIQKHPSALHELQQLWRTTLQDKLSLACVLEAGEGAPVLAGVNVLTVLCRGDKDEPFHTEDKLWAKLFGAVDAVARSVDIFARFGVEQYLTAYGLVVDPRWRGRGLGQALLQARIPIGKALGVSVTATVFTAGASQAVAKKAGFQLLSEITYEELAKQGFVFPGVEKDTKSSKLMALVIE